MFKAVIPDLKEEGIVMVRGVPFGSPGDRDLHGQFFTANTNFLQHIFPLPPVFHFHGAKTGSISEPIGSTLSRQQDSQGVMYKVKLHIDSAKEAVQQKALDLWDAAKSGKLFASSGSVEAAIKVADNGEILQWLVSELSLLDGRKGRETPANFHATVIPLKMEDHDIEAGDVTIDQLVIDSPDSEPASSDNGPGDMAEYVENMFNNVRDLYSDDAGLRETMLASYQDMFEVELQPITRSNKMSENGTELLAQLQQQVAEMTAQMATLQGQVTQQQGVIQEREGQITELRGVISTKSAEVAMGTHAGIVDTWIKDGKLTPAERDPMLEVLSFAYQADTTTKGDIGFVSAVQKLIEARPVNPVMGSPATVYSNMGDLNGGAANGVGGGVDPANIARLKRYAEIPTE